jgi:hypothetical protein
MAETVNWCPSKEYPKFIPHPTTWDACCFVYVKLRKVDDSQKFSKSWWWMNECITPACWLDMVHKVKLYQCQIVYFFLNKDILGINSFYMTNLERFCPKLSIKQERFNLGFFMLFWYLKWAQRGHIILVSTSIQFTLKMFKFVSWN